MKKIINCETGEVIEREFTTDELAQEKIDNKNFAEAEKAKLGEEADKLAKKVELLSKLGITEDEAKLLLSR